MVENANVFYIKLRMTAPGVYGLIVNQLWQELISEHIKYIHLLIMRGVAVIIIVYV